MRSAGDSQQSQRVRNYIYTFMLSYMQIYMHVLRSFFSPEEIQSRVFLCRYDDKIRLSLKPSVVPGPISPPHSPPLPFQQFGVPLSEWVVLTLFLSHRTQLLLLTKSMKHLHSWVRTECTLRCFLLLLFVIRLRHRAADSEGIPLVMRDTVGYLQENGWFFTTLYIFYCLHGLKLSG